MKKRKLWAILALSVVLSASSVGCSTPSQETSKTEQTEHKTNSSKKDDTKKDTSDEEDTLLKPEEETNETNTTASDPESGSSDTTTQTGKSDSTQNTPAVSSGSKGKTNSSSSETASKPNSSSSSGTSSKPSSSSSSSGTTSKPNSSSSSSGTTAKPSTPSAPQHTHSYTIPITKTVNVPEQGHYETRVVKEAQRAWRTFCNRCQADLTDMSDDDLAYHVAIICGGGILYKLRRSFPSRHRIRMGCGLSCYHQDGNCWIQMLLWSNKIAVLISRKKTPLAIQRKARGFLLYNISNRISI